MNPPHHVRTKLRQGLVILSETMTSWQLDLPVGRRIRSGSRCRTFKSLSLCK
jgi:hypothetical protein